ARPGRIRFDYVDPFRRKPVERGSALAAKTVLRRVGGATGRTRSLQRRPALTAEIHAGRIICAAPRAPQTGPPNPARRSAVEDIITDSREFAPTPNSAPGEYGPPPPRRGCWCYEISTVRSAVIDGMKKYPAAVSSTNCFGIVSVV